MTFTFEKPVTAKRGNDTAYVFRINTARPLTAETDNVLGACAQNPLYLNELLTEFLDKCASYFKNTTTVANVLKLLKHEVPESGGSYTAPYSLTPFEIVICKGLFYMGWNVTGELVQLNFPVEIDSDLMPTDADQIPFADTNEVIEVVPAISVSSRSQPDRTRVKEAQLRAKLAVYKANRAHLEYVEKYGEAPSDSEDDEEDSDDDSLESE